MDFINFWSSPIKCRSSRIRWFMIEGSGSHDFYFKLGKHHFKLVNIKDLEYMFPLDDYLVSYNTNQHLWQICGGTSSPQIFFYNWVTLFYSL